VNAPPLPEITPANVVLAAAPAVSVFVHVAEHNEMDTPDPVPEVAIDPTVSLLFARLNVVLFAIETGDVSEITPAAPSVSVPAEIVVAPV
jgi:hypothetical protein